MNKELEEKILQLIIEEFKMADTILPIKRCYFLKNQISELFEEEKENELPNS